MKRSAKNSAKRSCEQKKESRLVAFISQCVPSLLERLYLVFLFFTLLILIFVDKKIQYDGQNLSVISNDVLLLFVAFALSIIVGIRYYLRLKSSTSLKVHQGSEQNFYMLLGFGFLAFFIVQLIIANNIYFLGGWDVDRVRSDAYGLGIMGAIPTSLWYYSRCSNNLFLMYYLAFLFKISELFMTGNYQWFVVIYVCLNVTLSLYLTSCCIYRMLKDKYITIMASVLGVLLIGLSPWIVIPYSDALGMIFPVLSITAYLFVKRKYLRTFLTILPCVIGSYIKPTVYVLLIAFAIIKACQLLPLLFKQFELRKVGLQAISIGLAFFMGMMTNTILLSVNQMELNTNDEFGIAHYLMIGMNQESDGGYNRSDVTFSASFKNADERKNANLKVALERLESFSFQEFIRFFTVKTLRNYNEGTFSWGGEGSFFMEFIDKDSSFATALRNYYYTPETGYGENNDVFATLQQALWLFTLISMMLCLFKKKNSLDVEPILALTLLGMSLCHLIFESRGRYFYIVSPLFVMLAAVGLSKLDAFVFRKDKGSAVEISKSY